jgi:fermentation-respiration switch protein FrsA (DUF1100 family)
MRVLRQAGAERLERWGMRSDAAEWLTQHLGRSAQASYRRVQTPVLALYGGEDLQVPPSEADGLRQYLGPRAEIETIEGLDHLLLPVTMRPGLGWYADPDRRLSPVLLERVSNWLDRQPCIRRNRASRRLPRAESE